MGRGAQRAYAYFFRHNKSAPTPEGRQRLDTIAENTQLGAGFSIAMRDLEIRGSGEILGARQSGHIAAVGFHLYTQLLAQEVKHLKGEGEAPRLTISTPTVTIDLPLPTYIPTTFISEPALRIQLYRRLAELDDLGWTQRRRPSDPRPARSEAPANRRPPPERSVIPRAHIT